MNQSLRWGYAVNHWKPGFMGFARREEHERAFKVTSACGFRAIELNAGSGRWDPLGRPENIDINYGSPEAFLAQLNAWGIDEIASIFYDPGLMSFEDLHHGLLPTRRDDHDMIVKTAHIHAKLLSRLGGACLVVRPFPSFWKEGALDAERLQAAVDCWNRVGELAAALGIKTALHLDALSALRTTNEIDDLLSRVSAQVGLAFDTAELTIAGHDVTALYRRYHTRVQHFHFKNALAIDTLEEYRLPNADRAMMQAGGSREIGRWFSDLGDAAGLVDFPRLVAAMRELGYPGWVIVESDKGPPPLTTPVLLNSWYVHRVLERQTV